MKAKRILAVLLSAAVLSASTVVGTALTAAADTATVPAVKEIVRPDFVPMTDVSMLYREEGTVIIPKKADFGRLYTNHVYNANNMSMVLDNIQFAADADENAAVVVGFTKDKGGWYDGASLFLSFTKGGAVKLSRSWELGNNTPYKTETGFDFSKGRIEFSLKLEGDTYTLTANGKAVTFAKADLDGQSGLNMAAAPLAFGTTGKVNAFTVASVTGGEAGSVGGEFPVKTVEYSPTPDDQLKPPADGELVDPGFFGGDAMTITGSTVVLNSGRVGTKSSYNMNNAKIVFDVSYADPGQAPTSKIQVAFASGTAAWFDSAALIFTLKRDGSVELIKGRGVGGADPYRTIYNVFDFNEGHVELTTKLNGDNYIVTVNDGSFTIPVSEIAELFTPAEEGQKEPLNPEGAYVTFSKEAGCAVTFKVKNIIGEQEMTEFTPTPADQLKNPPAEGDIHNLWNTPGVTIGEAAKTGTKLTFAAGATAAGTRVGTKDTYDLSKMRVVINGIEGDAGVRMVMTSDDNGWTDRYSVMVNINPDNTLSVAKYYEPGKGTNAIITSVPLTTSVDEVIELTFRLVGEEYVLTVNGQEVKIAKETLADVFAEGRLQYNAAYLAFGIAADGTGAYNVADITGGKNKNQGGDQPGGDSDKDPDKPATGVAALPAALAVVVALGSAVVTAMTLKKKNNA